jgi:hypothetical protein
MVPTVELPLTVYPSLVELMVHILDSVLLSDNDFAVLEVRYLLLVFSE